MPAKKAKKTEKRQESQKMVDFGTSISRFWNKYIDFNGVAQRSEYWFAALFLFLVEFLLKVFSFVPFFGAIHWLWSIAIFIPCLSITFRRLHDAGFSAKWLFGLLAVPVLAFVLSWLIIVVTPGAIYDKWAGVALLYFMIMIMFVLYSLFWIIIGLFPSKFKNNKYRK